MKGSDVAVVSAALVSAATSIYLWFSGQHEAGLFVGLWVPSVLAFGIYVKLGRSRK